MPIPHGVGVRRLLSFVAAAVLVAAAVAQAQTSDTTPPVLASLSFSPTQIDTRNGDQHVTLLARITDNLTGLQYGCFYFRSPSSQQTQGVCVYDPDHLQTGSETDGVYRGVITIQPFAEAGTWRLYFVSLLDDIGNPRNYFENDLVAGGFPLTLEVASDSDTTPPSLDRFTLAPATIDTSESSATITLTLEMSDAQSGVDYACILLDSPKPGGTQYQYTCVSDFQRVAGDEQQGTYAIQVLMPQYAHAGTWHVASVELRDDVGNFLFMSESDLIAQDFQTTLQVQSNPTDTAAPVLVDFRFNPNAINTAMADATITAVATLRDDLSGTVPICVYFRSPSGLQQSRSGCLSFLSGEGLEQTYQGAITFPQFSEAGLWRAFIYAYDVVGNFDEYTEQDLLDAGFATTVAVASNTPEMPTIFGIVPGDGRLTVSFFPGADSGSPITNYKYSIDNGQNWITREPAATTSPLVITGLTNGVTYQVRLRAVNANGDGTPSLPVAGIPRPPAGVVLDNFDPGADDTVHSFVVQPDGKILVGGEFSTIGGGGPGQIARPRVARLNADGSVDQAFDASAIMGSYSEVWAIARQADGKILVGGSELADGRYLVRLNADGSLDPSFAVGLDSYVFALAVQPDGRILVGGAFSNISVGGVLVPRRGLARVNTDGSPDPGFDPSLDDEGHVEALLLQPDGRILVGGAFFSVDDVARNNLARLESNGALDPTFTTGVGSDSESFVLVTTLTPQPDGRLLVGGRFQTVTIGDGSTSRDNIARLNQDGSLDATFVPPPEYGIDGDFFPQVETIVVMPNGQLLVGGYSVAMGVAGEPGLHLARVNADGSVDAGFDAMVDWIVREAVALRDGPILIGGDFELVAGVPRLHLARIDVGIPGIPTIGPIAPGNGQVSVAFTAPASAFPIVNYDYSTDGGTTWTARVPASPASPIVITGLTNGVTYSIALRAVTATSPGNGSVPVAAAPITTPGAPALSAITPGNAQLTVAFSAPALDGGAAISNYEYSTNGGSTWSTRSPASTASPLVIAGLNNGTTYQVALRAVNAAGAGAASAVLEAMPSTTPAAPLLTGITPGNGHLTVVFIPGSNGGLEITNYEFSTNGGATWQPRVPAATTSPLLITGLTNGAAYGVLIRAVNANGAGAASAAASATPQATLDETVDAFNPGVDGEVRTLAIQSDGKILVGGQFTRLGEIATLPRNNLGRLNADGSVDATFNPPNIGPTSVVSAVLVLFDGRVVLAGDGPDPTGQRTYVARLLADGSFDGTFEGAANGPIFALAQQPSDGRLLIGGNFSAVGLSNEWPRANLARLHPDGTADVSFNPGVNGIVNAIAVQPDGRIVIGGVFTAVGSVPRSNLARLNPDGTVDLTFVGAAGGGVVAAAGDFSGPGVAALRVEPDGKILVGGRFTTLGGGSSSGVRYNIGRLNADGTLDTGFGAGQGSFGDSASLVETILVLPTRRILIGGVSVAAPHADGMPRHLARLHPDGSLDAEFDPRPDQRVRALALQSDGRVVVGGQFTTIGGNTRYRLARLSGSGPSSPVSPSTPVPFTDDALVAGTTPLRAIHIVELRTRVNALRQRFGLVAVGWTDQSLTGVPARALHILELQDALLQAFDAALLQGIAAPRPVFADAPLGPGLPIRALHVQQLRTAVQLLEGS